MLRKCLWRSNNHDHVRQWPSPKYSYIHRPFSGRTPPGRNDVCKINPGSPRYWQSFRLQMAKLHAGQAKSTRAARAKIGHTIRPTSASPQTRKVNVMEHNDNTREGLFLADVDQITDLSNSIDNDDLPPTNKGNSEEYRERLILMRGRDNAKPRIVKPPKIP